MWSAVGEALGVGGSEGWIGIAMDNDFGETMRDKKLDAEIGERERGQRERHWEKTWCERQ